MGGGKARTNDETRRKENNSLDNFSKEFKLDEHGSPDLVNGTVMKVYTGHMVKKAVDKLKDKIGSEDWQDEFDLNDIIDKVFGDRLL